jgi:hypothetical protein
MTRAALSAAPNKVSAWRQSASKLTSTATGRPFPVTLVTQAFWHASRRVLPMDHAFANLVATCHATGAPSALASTRLRRPL